MPSCTNVSYWHGLFHCIIFGFSCGQVRKELGIKEDVKILIYNFGGQVEFILYVTI